MTLGCFDSYKFDYSDQLPEDFDPRNNEKTALVVARRHCIDGEKFCALWDFIKSRYCGILGRTEISQGYRPEDVRDIRVLRS